MNASFRDAPPPSTSMWLFSNWLSLENPGINCAEVVYSSAAQNVAHRSAGRVQSTQLLAASPLQDEELIPMWTSYVSNTLLSSHAILFLNKTFSRKECIDLCLAQAPYLLHTGTLNSIRVWSKTKNKIEDSFKNRTFFFTGYGALSNVFLLLCYRRNHSKQGGGASCYLCQWKSMAPLAFVSFRVCDQISKQAGLSLS